MNQLLSFTPGSVLSHGGRDVVVLDVLDVESVFVRYCDDGTPETVRISELTRAQVNLKDPKNERAARLIAEALPLISDKRWMEARERLLVLRDLLRMGPGTRGKQLIDEAAEKLGKSPATVYRWLAEYDKTHSIRVFLRLPRNDKGSKKIPGKIDRLIRAVIRAEYLTEQRKMVSTVVEAVEHRCRRKKWTPPHKSTIVRRIQELRPRQVVEAREGRRAARGRHALAKGAHPVVAYPLELWQLDHTPSDYCIVDEVYRRPIDGAQTLSVALDINTRCVMGFTLMMEAPSVRVAGACMAHAILPKERFLQEMDVDASWPCYGRPSVLYTDNASEFEAKYFVKACDMNNIETRKRPKGQPNYAGHIESLFRTFLQKVHELEGSRFANLQKRMDYDSTGRAIMTIQEFRRWFTIFITKYYHQKPHSGLCELPPIKAWERGILGDAERPGIGLPDRVDDEFKLRVDFLPGLERTVQDYGIQIERMKFSHDVLRNWVGAPDPQETGKARKFVVKFDPYDMSEIYFLDPDLGQYFPIPHVGALEHITYWENLAIKREVRKSNRGQINHDTIAEGLSEMREVLLVAAKSTRRARRDQQRTIDSQRNSVPKIRKAEQHADVAATEVIKRAKSGPVVDDDDEVQPMPGAVLPSMNRSFE